MSINFRGVKFQSYDVKPERYEWDNESEFKGDSIGWCALVTRHANCCDYVLLLVGILCGFGFGASGPLFAVAFGGSVDGMGAGDQAAASIKEAYT